MSGCSHGCTLADEALRLCIESVDLWSRQCSGGSEDKCCAVSETMRVKVWWWQEQSELENGSSSPLGNDV